MSPPVRYLKAGLTSFAVYILSTIPTWYLVDIWGRRPILLSGALVRPCALLFGPRSLLAVGHGCSALVCRLLPLLGQVLHARCSRHVCDSLQRRVRLLLGSSTVVRPLAEWREEQN